jgi:hypothetical protein
LIAPAIYSIGGFRLTIEGPFCMSSLVDRLIRRIASALLSLEHAALQRQRPTSRAAKPNLSCPIRVGITPGPFAVDVVGGQHKPREAWSSLTVDLQPLFGYPRVDLGIENCQQRLNNRPKPPVEN